MKELYAPYFVMLIEKGISVPLVKHLTESNPNTLPLRYS